MPHLSKIIAIKPVTLLLSLGAIALALSGCASAPEGRPGPNGLWLEKPALLSAANPALIAQYNVSFVLAEQASLPNRDNSPTSPPLRVTVQGISSDDMTAIAEAAYADFVQQLKDRGFAMSTRSLDEQLSPFAIRQLSKNTLQGPGKNVALFRQHSDNRIDTLTVGPEALPVVRPDQHLAIGIAAGENGTRPITVDYTLRLARLNPPGPGQSQIGDTGIAFVPGVELIEGSHLALYHNPKKVAKVTLRGPISYDRGGRSSELRAGESSDEAKIYHYQVDAAQFKSAALAILKQANSRMISALR
ncbi:hypothetical protein I6N98_12060 [Spongiibacter nanhainus]|uniref:Lipoprotein n=1 Tax=Spongiibacter nanhainus TaxID=2794344 RepID=A0A7T4QYM4_9GAMM|nr:hypothetical protein [Spongiibacter nanhainus]QQD17101.1 hypothetical protein I6N98_12060 [Spongiibacter nanhainus]